MVLDWFVGPGSPWNCLQQLGRSGIVGNFAWGSTGRKELGRGRLWDKQTASWVLFWPFLAELQTDILHPTTKKMSSLGVLATFVLVLVSCRVVENRFVSPAQLVVDLVGGFESRGYDEAFREIWGKPRKVDSEGQHVELSLDRSSSGGGFVSQDRLYHGFFSAAIKLPGNYSAGVVTAFYTSNQDIYPKHHDEFDLEFLGVRPGSPYVLQTNIYGDGSTNIGREERLHLWFDPTKDYHNYSILWNQYHTVFFVDNVPVREMVKTPELGLQYPSKPQSLYTTIWDGSQWATEGGKYPVDYSLAPYKAFFKDIKLEGCVWNDATDEVPPCSTSSSASLNRLDGPDFKNLNDDQKKAMKWVRSKYLWYSYCDDVKRYPEAPVDCPSREEGPQAGAKSSSSSHSRSRKRGKKQLIERIMPRM